MSAPKGNKYAKANSKYKPEYCEKAVQLGRQGKSFAQIASHFDVSRQTIDNWADKHPKFLDALSRARTHAQAWWEEKGIEGMHSREFNSQIWKKSMEARFREDYTERKDLDLNHGGNVIVEIKK